MSYKNERKRGWCFTAYENEWENIQKLLDTADYNVIGKETCPTTGRKHLQCYGYWNDKISFSEIKRWYNGNIESAKGSASQNLAYCSKEGDFTTKGDMPQQGKRTDIADFRDAILAGASEEELLMEFPEMLAKYDRFYQRCRNIVLKKRAKELNEIEVIVLTGEPGVGKTHQVFAENNPDDIYTLGMGDGTEGSIWWNHYDGESVILIDDFHCDLKLTYMLKLCDKYPMKLATKGGYTYKCAKKIYITSNIPIDKWYMGCADVHRRALMRRITTNLLVHNCQRICNKTSTED